MAPASTARRDVELWGNGLWVGGTTLRADIAKTGAAERVMNKLDLPLPPTLVLPTISHMSSEARPAITKEELQSVQPKFESTYDWSYNAAATAVMQDVTGEVRAFTKAQTAGKLTFQSQWGDGLSKGPAYEMWKKQLQTRSQLENRTVWGLEDQRPNSAANGDRFFAWVRREHLYYRDIVAPEAIDKIDAWLARAPPAHRREFLEVFRALWAAANPQGKLSVSHLHYRPPPVARPQSAANETTTNLAALERESNRRRCVGSASMYNRKKRDIDEIIREHGGVVLPRPGVPFSAASTGPPAPDTHTPARPATTASMARPGTARTASRPGTARPATAGGRPGTAASSRPYTAGARRAASSSQVGEGGAGAAATIEELAEADAAAALEAGGDVGESSLLLGDATAQQATVDGGQGAAAQLAWSGLPSTAAGAVEAPSSLPALPAAEPPAGAVPPRNISTAPAAPNKLGLGMFATTAYADQFCADWRVKQLLRDGRQAMRERAAKKRDPYVTVPFGAVNSLGRNGVYGNKHYMLPTRAPPPQREALGTVTNPSLRHTQREAMQTMRAARENMAASKSARNASACPLGHAGIQSLPTKASTYSSEICGKAAF